jgi:integrase
MRFIDNDKILCSEISKRDIHDFLLHEAQRLQEDEKDNFLVNMHIRHFRALFNYGIDNEYLERDFINPTERIKFFDVQENIKYIPDDISIQKVRKILQKHQLSFFDFIMETGVRSSSALRLVAENFVDEDTLYVPTKKKGGGLRHYIIKPPKNYKKLIAGKHNNERVFDSWVDYPRFVEKACYKIQETEKDFRIFTIHSLRHRKASMMNKKGKTIFDIMSQMGHENMQTTQIYLRKLP